MLRESYPLRLPFHPFSSKPARQPVANSPRSLATVRSSVSELSRCWRVAPPFTDTLLSALHNVDVDVDVVGDSRSAPLK